MPPLLDINKLDGSPGEHDVFVWDYLTNTANYNKDNPDVVRKAIKAMLKAPVIQKLGLEAFVRDELSGVGKAASVVNNINRLALYFLLKHFPESWIELKTAALDVLKGLLTEIKKTRMAIYPPSWSVKIFRLENLLKPKDVKGTLFGIDPIPHSRNVGKYATGHAFCFDVPTDVDIGDIESSTALQEVYGLTQDISLKSSKSLEYRMTLPYGISFVNFIRTIAASDKAGSGNRFLHAWIGYNLAWLKLLNNDNIHPVLIFQGGGDYTFDDYVKNFESLKTLLHGALSCAHPSYRKGKKEFEKVKWLLQGAPRCAHPSYLKGKEDHCVYAPNAKSQYSTWLECNTSVTQFQTFMSQIGAADLVGCACPTCQSIASTTTADLFKTFCNMTL